MDTNTPYDSPINEEISGEMGFFILSKENKQFDFKGKIYQDEVDIPDGRNQNLRVLKDVKVPIHYSHTPISYLTMEI